MSDIKKELETLNETDDYTSRFSKEDISSNKPMAIVAYLGILVLIPIFAAKDSPFARFHSNQGLVLFLAWLIFAAFKAALGIIPLIRIIVKIIYWVACVAIAVLSILGIVNAAQGKAKDLPLIGKIRILK